MLREATSTLARRQALAAGPWPRQAAGRGLASVASGAGGAPSSSSSSLSSSSRSSWKQPIAPGTEPAYDEALKFISEQQAALRQQVPGLKAEAEKHAPGSQARSEAQTRLHSFEVASQINDPAVRWRFEHDPDVPLSTPVFAHLRQQAWRRNALPKVLERIRVMKVLPDVVPSIAPTVDVQVAFGHGAGLHDHGGDGGDVLVGCFVGADKSLQPPTVTATPFHAEERLYTLTLVDADAPYEAEDRVASKALWLVHNVPLSLTRTTVDLQQAGDIVLPYVAPHPERGTPYHRYVLVVLEQPQALPQAGGGEAPARQRLSIHDMIAQHSLTPAGIHFWRAIWTEETRSAVSSIYRDVLRLSEPHFARTLG